MGTIKHGRHGTHHAHIPIVGLSVSAYSNQLLRELAAEAQLHSVNVTSVRRRVPDQAEIFYKKHVLEPNLPNYRNTEVAKLIHRAKEMHQQGRRKEEVESFLINAIENVHGGPGSVSNHLGAHIFTEIFDVAHYSGPTSGPGRRNAMTDAQAKAFLAGCRERMPSIITRLGHSAELGFELPGEFADEKCFHFEVKQPLYDKLELPATTFTV